MRGMMLDSPAPEELSQRVQEPTEEPESVGILIPFPVVGIGASAGGLEAFLSMFRALPADTGMAFVVVQHLAPGHASSLAEILSRSTTMPVTEIKHEHSLHPNRVYIMPADKNVEVSGGALHLIPRETEGRPRSIDRFFRSLANSQKHMAIGVVLSGTASDGTLGLKAIKSEGGITFAQDGTALHDGMPHSAIASGSVDFVLSPDAIAREIARIGEHPYSDLRSGLPEPEDGEELRPILKILYHGTGVDFTDYKANTLYRRVTRRMVLRKVSGLRQYAEILRKHPAEVEALYQDFLISVTSFFRNPEAFEALKATGLPRLVADRSPSEPVRVWSVGCSTGEEAYSIAIAYEEFSEAAGIRVPLQLFATDLNASGIDRARPGIYPKDIAQDVSPERLRRFFTEVDGTYRINKSIRDACVFSRHNVLNDPPFSRIDLISCRNLLIYLEQVLQERIIPSLHYALKPAGLLFLGGSETIGRYRDLFEVADSRHRIYVRKPFAGRRAIETPQRRLATEAGAPTFRTHTGADLQHEADRFLIAKFAPPGVLVSRDLEILQFRGNTGAYLSPAPGRASLGLLKMLREGLIVAVRAALLQAEREGTTARREGLRVRSEGGFRDVSVEVVPVGRAEGGERGFLVLFEEGKPAEAGPPAQGSTEPQPQQEVARLTEELNTTREYLQSVIEQQDASNEELQSANEEIQSANEELQSTNEELETSKEEIQSSNEELVTINDELSNVNRELARINDDLANVLDSVRLPIVLLGPDFRIRRITPAAERTLNLAPADVGRLLGSVRLEIEIPDLERMLAEVLDTVSMKELEVRDRTGRWQLLRARPYRTLDNRIDGVVLTLVDVDDLKRVQEYTQNIVATLREPILVLDERMRVHAANESFYTTFGVSKAETEGRVFYELGNGQWNRPELRRLMEEILPERRCVENFVVTHEFEGLGRRTMLLNARELIRAPGEKGSRSVLLAIEDVTERTEERDALQQSKEWLQETDRRKNEFLAMLAHELRNPLAPIRNAIQILKRTEGKGEEAVPMLDMMERQVSQMVRFVDDLLDVSRINMGRIDLRRGPVDLASPLNLAAEAARPLIRSLDQELAITLPARPIYVDADPARLAQAVGNLLHNASKFSDAGSMIRLSAARQDGQAVILVQDSGIGIDADELPRIFDLFVQADTSLERTRSGLGIGLTLVKLVTEMHGGTVEARSTGRGLGSEFLIRLPILPRASAPRTERRAGKPAAATPRRILVVDDNRDSAQSLTRLLVLAGHETETAHDGEVAMEKAETFRPDVALLDIGLPKVNGYGVATWIREQPWGRKVLLVGVSGWGRDDDRQRAKEAGFDAYMVKPMDHDELEKLLAEMPVRTE
jgi:two-component system, chemotaxis family, CheB/CheR fusion protein